MAETLAEIHAAQVAAGRLRPDPAQTRALTILEDIRACLEAAPRARRGLLGGLFHRPEAVARGLYLWGGVGRGKSMLMDMFVDNLGIREKRRVHFHAFMQEVHARLHSARADGAEDALVPVAAALTKGLRLLALDEMQISDITDAMVVGRLFEKFLEAGVVIVTTSNRAPEELYKDGLNRQLFLPFIALLKRRLVVHELLSPLDYRQQRLGGARVWFTPDDAAARARMDAIWHDLAGGAGTRLVLQVQGRETRLPQFRNGVARAGFHDLCGQPLGPADFLEIARRVRVLMLDHIPRMGRTNFNEAKRFVILVDALYEARRQLIASAAAAPGMLYVEGDGAFEFERTASRLIEMQGPDWV